MKQIGKLCIIDEKLILISTTFHFNITDVNFVEKKQTQK